MSIFRFSSGTQKLWITSAVRTSSRIGVRTGMWISFALTAWNCGYRTSHHHWCPITCTVSLVPPLAGASVVRITNRSEITKSVVRRTIGRAIPAPTTTNHDGRSPGLSPVWSRPRPRRFRRNHERTSKATISASPSQAPPIIHQNRLAMSRAWWLLGEQEQACHGSDDWAPPAFLSGSREYLLRFGRGHRQAFGISSRRAKRMKPSWSFPTWWM